MTRTHSGPIREASLNGESNKAVITVSRICHLLRETNRRGSSANAEASKKFGRAVDSAPFELQGDSFLTRASDRSFSNRPKLLAWQPTSSIQNHHSRSKSRPIRNSRSCSEQPENRRSRAESVPTLGLDGQPGRDCRPAQFANGILKDV